ncbi:MAG TPA: LacI family DNA-binding transcriptional regulator [Micromonosporaceae bacterium]
MPVESGAVKARLSDIAAQAGVSEATVSRVLNGKSGVSEATRDAVLTALDLLGGERPARLRQRRLGLIGLIIPELENPIFPMFAQMIERELTQAGYTTILCTQWPGGTTEDDYVELLLERAISGIVFVSGLHADATADHSRYSKLVVQRLPIVLVNGVAPEVDAPFISSDDGIAAELAVAHLASLGHRRIGLAVGPERFYPAQRKAAGFRRAMQRLGSDALINHSLYSVEGGYASAGQLLDAGVTAIVCGSDLMALGAVRVARQRGIAVPDDVSIVGYDDSPLMAFTDPPLTTVRQPVAAMCRAAVGALLDEIAGVPVPRTEFLFRPELVVRSSTGPVPTARSSGRSATRA